MKLVVDSRERALFEYFDEVEGHEDFIVKAQITTADYALILDDAILEIFERKSLKDYADSFKDGRHNNKNKLLSMRDNTGCNIFYVVEGVAPKNKSDKINGIKYSAIEASMFNMMSNCGIFVIRTDSAADTARMLLAKRVALMNSMKNGKFDNKLCVSDPMSMLTERPIVTCDTIIIAMFECITGVSNTTAHELAKNINVADVIFECKRKELGGQLASIKVNGRKLSSGVVKSIMNMTYVEASALFGAIPGIKNILPFEEAMMEGPQNIDELCDLLVDSYGEKRLAKIKKIMHHTFGN